MSILTGSEIVRQRDLGHIIIDPFDDANVGPNSYDLTLGPTLLFYHETLLSMRREHAVKSLNIPHKSEDKGLILYPDQLYLGHTVERCGSDSYVCCLEGRSSLARLGISVHLTAGFGDLFFKDQWTLEITVVKPVEVWSWVRVCQAIFYVTEGVVDRKYVGKYKGQTGPRPSRMYKDFEVKR
jgi:dCTP deaminase